MAPRTKDARLEARLTTDQDELLRWAADARGVSLSAFVLEAALERAQRLQLREQVTLVSRTHYPDFERSLDAPPQRLSGMRPLAEAELFEGK